METSGAVFVGALTAVIAVWGILTQRIIHRRRATLEFVSKSEADADLIAARKKFIHLAHNGGLVAFAAADQEDSEEVQAIRLVLNEFELVAIGIRRGIIDYKLYAMWNSSGAKKYWAHAAPFVGALRTRIHNNNIYKEFEVLVGWLNSKPPRWTTWWNLWF